MSKIMMSFDEFRAATGDQQLDHFRDPAVAEELLRPASLNALGGWIPWESETVMSFDAFRAAAGSQQFDHFRDAAAAEEMLSAESLDALDGWGEWPPDDIPGQ